MPEIPDRDKIEKEFARALAKALQMRRGQILELLGDPPDINNLPSDIWEEIGKELAPSILPFTERTFVEAAGRMIAEAPIEISWTLVNQRAADWARDYTYDLVKQLTDTTRVGLQDAVSTYFEEGQTMGDLVERIGQYFSPVRAETIAITEVTRAASQGEQAIAEELRQAGIEMVAIWLTDRDYLVCDECEQRNGKPQSEWETNEFPPLHPRCRCDIGYELPKGEEAAAVEEEQKPEGYTIADSPTDWLVEIELEEAKLPLSHTDGLVEINFNEGSLIQNKYEGKITEAYGVYNPVSKVITLSSNADNVAVYGGNTILHEIGHHVHLANMTNEAALEWSKISVNNGAFARISAYARTNQGEHFAEAYRAYARGGSYRAGLRNLEPNTYNFMRNLFKENSKYILPENEFAGIDQFWIRYNPAKK